MSHSSNKFSILHLTDTHLYGDGTLHYGKVDTTAALDRTLNFLEKIQRLDLIVCSGDVSEDGSVESYQKVQQLLGDYAKTRGAELVFAMGNHDRRFEFQSVLGLGQSASAVVSSQTKEFSAHDSPAIFSVAEYRGVRVVVLDTSVPMKGSGFLATDQLNWLREVLATPAANGTVVVMHHAPIPAQTKLLGALELKNVTEFGEIIAGSDVRLILAGHYHLTLIEQFASVPVIVSSAVSNQATQFDDPQEESASFGSGGSLVELTVSDPKNPSGFRILPFVVSEADEVFRFNAQQVDFIISKAS